MDRHDATKALLTDYVLGELDVTARRDVEEHLRTCTECATEVRDLNEAFHDLASTVEPLAASPEHRARVLADFERVHAHPEEVEPVPRSVWSDLRPWYALAAVLVLALAALLVLSERRASRDAAELARVRSELDALQLRLSDVEQQADLVVSILTAPDMREVGLAGVAPSSNAVARAYWSSSRGLLIVADRLPVAPEGRGYQVWLIGNAAPVSAGMLSGEGQGRGILIARPPSGLSGSTITVAVTDEPAGGLAAPSGSQHLVGSI